MSKPDGGPAFPSTQVHISSGMTLRDYFAAKVLQGLIANPTWMTQAKKNAPHLESRNVVSGVAYDIADAMIAEREK